MHTGSAAYAPTTRHWLQSKVLYTCNQVTLWQVNVGRMQAIQPCLTILQQIPQIATREDPGADMRCWWNGPGFAHRVPPPYVPMQR